MKDDKDAVSNRTCMIPFKTKISDKKSKKVNGELGITTEYVTELFEEIERSCRHLSLIMERGLFCYELFCKALKNKRFNIQVFL